MANKYLGEKIIEIGGDLRHIRYDMNACAVLEGNLGDKPISEIFKSTNVGIKVIREALLVGLRHKGNPKLTRKEVGDWMSEDPARLGKWGEAIGQAINLAMGGEDEETAEGADGPLPETPTESAA